MKQDFGIISLGTVKNIESLEFLKSISKISEIPFVRAGDIESWVPKRVREFGIGDGAGGCLIGHHLAWRHISKSLSCALVVEDDILFTKYGHKYLRNVIDYFVSSDLQVLHLGTHEKFNYKLCKTLLLRLAVGKLISLFYYHLVLRNFSPRFLRGTFPYSTHAYLIKSPMARILTKVNTQSLIPVDVLLNAASQVKQNKFASTATPLAVQDSVFESRVAIYGR